MRPHSTTSLRASIAFAVDVAIQRIDELEEEVARLKKENASLWGTVHELQDKRETA
jgi:FtsZ-binding cell division protein ZapB